MDKASLNNQIVLMRKPVSDAVVHVIRELIKKKKMVASKIPRKAGAILEQIIALKAINKDEVSKFALMNTKSLSEGMSNGLHLDARDKVMLRLATHKVVGKSVSLFRKRYPNWEKEIPLLLKVLGIKSKKKNRVQKETGAGTEGSEDKKTNASTTEVEESKKVSNLEGVEESPLEEESEDSKDERSGESSKDEGSSEDSQESEDEGVGEDRQERELEEGVEECERREDHDKSIIVGKKKNKVTYKNGSILKLKKEKVKSREKPERAKDITCVNSSEQENKKSPRKGPINQKVKIKMAKSPWSLVKKPCFVVSDKVSGTAEVRKLKLDLLDTEEIPVSKNSKDEIGDKDYSMEESGFKDSFFLRGDGIDSGEEEEITREERKENYNNVKCNDGLNRRQRRNALFGREDRVRSKKFLGRSQFSSGSPKHYSSSPHSKGFHKAKNSLNRDVMQTSHGETTSSRNNTGKQDSSVLHPSWAAKRKLNQQTVSAFQGKKIKFDE